MTKWRSAFAVLRVSRHDILCVLLILHPTTHCSGIGMNPDEKVAAARALRRLVDHLSTRVRGDFGNSSCRKHFFVSVRYCVLRLLFKLADPAQNAKPVQSYC